MRIYLAGKWEEAEKISAYARELRFDGHRITMPWFDIEVGEQIDKVRAALNDLQGVRMADCCIFIFENDLNYRGAYAELGMSLALGKQTIVVGDAGKRNVFTYHPLVEHVETWEEAKKLLRWATC